MLKFQESLLHFIWQYKLLKPVTLITVSGQQLFVLRPGELNRDAGPDFFNASIKLNDLTLAGNIEIHLKSSDWLRHQHQLNKAYDNIILHVVYEHDKALDQNKVNNVEVLELKGYLDEATIIRYNRIFESKEKLACADQLNLVKSLKFTSWVERMAIERLENKVKSIEALFETYGRDFTQVFYILLLRSFGFRVNALPFELLAKHLPVYLVLKQHDNLMLLEAMLLGVSGMLEEQFEDKYMCSLQNEFEYLKQKYQLPTLQKEIFKFSRLRPANFPGLRIVQFAALVHKEPKLITAPYLYTEYNQLKSSLCASPGNYWRNRFRSGGKLAVNQLSIGQASTESIIINAYAPFLFFYSKMTGKTEFADASMTLLTNCGFENNIKTKLYNTKKDVFENAATSQGLINLYDNYCRPKRCLNCGIAAAILNPEI